jgi:exonuclease SbcC
MKLLRTAFHGFCGFEGGELDLRAVPPGLVALTGPNWQGKTTYLELPLAAWFREWASRENNDITRWADVRHAWVESDLELDDAVYRARVNVDGQTRKSQAVVSRQRPNGSWEYLNDGKVSTFDLVVAQLLPPKDALLCSQFAAQNRAGSLTAASRSKRKDLFIQFLWLEHLIAMSETAKLCCNIADATVRALRVVLARLDQDSSEELEEFLLGAVSGAKQAHADYGVKIAGLTDRIAALTGDRERVVQDAMAYRDAVAEQARLVAERARLQAGLAECDSADEASATRLEEALLAADALRERALAALAGKIASVQALVAQRDAIADAVRERDSLADDLDRVQKRISEIPTEERALDAALSDVNAAALRDRVPCSKFAVTAGQFDSCQFLVNAAAAAGRLDGRTAHDLSSSLSALGDERKALTGRLAASKARLAAVRPLADKHAALAVADDRLEEYDNAGSEADDQHETAVRTARDRRTSEQQAHARRRAELETLVSAVTGAAEAVDVRLVQHASAAADLAALDQTLSAVRTELVALERDRGAASARIESSEGLLAGLQARRVEATQVRHRLAAVEDELRVQSILARVLHRDGLPTLEIAVAAPAISQLTTDLLEHSGFGMRFRVDVTTLVPTADGKEWKEDFAIRVWDNDRGKEILGVGDLSGGERVLVEEALRAALTIYMASRGTRHVRTCWRDETTGPLDAENRPKYIRMLRRLRELGHYDHVLFISQTSDVVDMADTVFDVCAGKATLR